MTITFEVTARTILQISVAAILMIGALISGLDAIWLQFKNNHTFEVYSAVIHYVSDNNLAEGAIAILFGCLLVILGSKLWKSSINCG